MIEHAPAGFKDPGRLTGRAIRLAGAAALLAAAFAGTVPALADVRSYRFELVDEHLKEGGGAIVTVRLVHAPTRRVVPDAIIFISRLDMAPDGMRDMDAPLDPLPDSLPGYYRFETDLAMEGRWALTLAAKVPGVSGAVQDRLVLHVDEATPGGSTGDQP